MQCVIPGCKRQTLRPKLQLCRECWKTYGNGGSWRDFPRWLQGLIHYESYQRLRLQRQQAHEVPLDDEYIPKSQDDYITVSRDRGDFSLGEG